MRCLEFIECYDESFLYAEDYELWARLIFQENLKGENLSEKLFEYRIFAGQSSAVHQEYRKLKNIWKNDVKWTFQ